MGIIRAVASSAMDVAGEQWKEFFYCDSLPENILLVRGKKHISEHSANNRMDDGVITNGSIIAVADGQGAIAVSQGKVIAEYSEPGEHIFEDPYHPGGVKGFLKETGNRISFGGGVQTVQQRIYYFNTKEIIGIRFEGNVSVNLHSGDFQSNLSLSGVFSYRVCDPMVFYKMVTGNVAMQYDRSRLNGMLISELKTALAMAVSKTGLFRTSDLGLHTDDLITELKAVLGPMWKEKRGLELVRIAFDSGDFSAADAISDIQMTEVFAGPGALKADRTATETETQPETQSSQETEPGPQMRPVGKIGSGAGGGGEWTCSCGVVSSGNFCPECGAARVMEWSCSCGMRNMGKFCTNCGKPAIK
ncbi:MAG: SPFH domain-containing protein [Lachnospiraceae bacterium]|nr:SPFH domain-containing protein [Lachnospiraceae bacterium]